MGSSSLLSEPRRKRKRTARATASFRLNYGTAGKNEGRRCARCLPWIAGLFGLTMAVVVCVRNGFKDSAREKARDERLGRAEDHARSHPLVLLLEGQHDIGSQVSNASRGARRRCDSVPVYIAELAWVFGQQQ